MRPNLRITALAVLLLAATLAPAAARAQDVEATGEDLASRYRLTVENVAKFERATQNVIAAERASPGLLRGRTPGRLDEPVDSAVAAYEQTPALNEAIEHAGMSARQYVYLTWALMQAAARDNVFHAMDDAALRQALADGPGLQNVLFFRAHREQLRRIGRELETRMRRAGLARN